MDTELVPDLAGSGIASTFSVTGWHYEPKFQPRVRHMVYASDLGTIEQEGRSTKIRAWASRSPWSVPPSRSR